MTPGQIAAFIAAAIEGGQTFEQISNTLAAAAGVSTAASQGFIDQYLGARNLDRQFQPVAVDRTGMLTADEALDPVTEESLQSRVDLRTAFDRFLAGQPSIATPGLRAAAGRIAPLARTQFALQPMAGGLMGGFGEFRDFLTSGGAFLRGDALTNRLKLLTESLQRFGPGSAGDPNIHPLQAALQQQFQLPTDAFQAYQLPTLQGAVGVGRDLLVNAFRAFENRFFNRNPEASALDVARQFGFSDVLAPGAAPPPPPPPPPPIPQQYSPAELDYYPWLVRDTAQNTALG